ncbi:hypothetical protein D3C73_1171990 [compost metagenome]
MYAITSLRFTRLPTSNSFISRSLFKPCLRSIEVFSLNTSEKAILGPRSSASEVGSVIARIDPFGCPTRSPAGIPSISSAVYPKRIRSWSLSSSLTSSSSVSGSRFAFRADRVKVSRLSCFSSFIPPFPDMSCCMTCLLINSSSCIPLTKTSTARSSYPFTTNSRKFTSLFPPIAC